MIEADVEIVLWDWLKTKGETIREIYFNRKNKLDWKIFKVKGLQEKPDLVIEIDNGYEIKYYAIEVKHGENSLGILKSSKIIEYCRNYVNKKTEYYIDDKLISIKGFLIATKNSLKGHIFENENLIDNWSDTESKSKYVASMKYKIIPRFEGSRTFEFIRTLWCFYDKIRNDTIERCDLGILIADVNENFVPKIMITSYKDYLLKPKWGQRWCRI